MREPKVEEFKKSVANFGENQVFYINYGLSRSFSVQQTKLSHFLFSKLATDFSNSKL